VSIGSPEELAAMRAAGLIVRRVLEAMKKQVRPGITTAELDRIGRETMEASGARSAPASVYNFPGANCISLNEEAVHGVPGDRALREGDLLKLDVTVEKDGYMADAAETIAVGTVTEEGQRLIRCAQRFSEGHAGGARRVSCVGNWTGGGTGSAARRIFGDPGIGRARHRKDDSRRTTSAELYGPRGSGNINGRIGDRSGTDYCGRFGASHRGAGWLDDADGRSQTGGPLRAYDRHYARGSGPADGLERQKYRYTTNPAQADFDGHPAIVSRLTAGKFCAT